ncbi:MAG: hypothetical protein KAG56_00325 [Sulfurovaceae bacterium]|nr:hypothetical protein [Sulfurovaceae bacterium]
MVKSKNQYDIIYSNVDYIDKLLIDGISPDNIFETDLKSYYVHLYLVQVKGSGFTQLDQTIGRNSRILYYIRTGLRSIKASKNLNLFNQYLMIKERNQNNKSENYNIFDKIFTHINKQENILQLNANWLESNKKLAISNKDIYQNINIKTVKKLCRLANEEYVRITSYDQNNLYSNSCYFKTVHSYFYMIKEKNRYVMYNSFTKREVSSIRVKETEKNRFFSTLWSNMKG